MLIFLMVLFLVGQSLAELHRSSVASGLKVARSAVERAVMQCYALEGAYPPDLDYLQENYGLILDRGQYDYLYEIVAGNIHPVIQVQRLEDVTS
jgi:hypothetical protein